MAHWHHRPTDTVQYMHRRVASAQRPHDQAYPPDSVITTASISAGVKTTEDLGIRFIPSTALLPYWKSLVLSGGVGLTTPPSPGSGTTSGSVSGSVGGDPPPPPPPPPPQAASITTAIKTVEMRSIFGVVDSAEAEIFGKFDIREPLFFGFHHGDGPSRPQQGVISPPVHGNDSNR